MAGLTPESEEKSVISGTVKDAPDLNHVRLHHIENEIFCDDHQHVVAKSSQAFIPRNDAEVWIACQPRDRCIELFQHGSRSGRIVLLEIDVEGANNIKRQYPQCVSVFIMPPTLEELRSRITKRGTEPPEMIEKRLQRAENEMRYSSEYDYIIVNHTVEEAADRFLDIIRQKREQLAKQASNC